MGKGARFQVVYGDRRRGGITSLLLWTGCWGCRMLHLFTLSLSLCFFFFLFPLSSSLCFHLDMLLLPPWCPCAHPHDTRAGSSRAAELVLTPLPVGTPQQSPSMRKSPVLWANTLTPSAGGAVLPMFPVIGAEVPAWGGQGGRGADVLWWEDTADAPSIYNCTRYMLWLC